MAFVVLFSTMSFTIDMHYCGDILVDAALFQEAESCGMEMELSSNKECSITKKNCCSNKQLKIEGQNELQLQLDNISFNKQVFITTFMYSYINLFESLDAHVISFEEYKPPLITELIFKKDERYLI